MTQLTTKQQKREVRLALFQRDEGHIFLSTNLMYLMYLNKEIQP